MDQNEKEKIIKDFNDETTDEGKHCKMVRERFSEYIRERYDLLNHTCRSLVSCLGFYEEFIVINTGVNKKLNQYQDCHFMEIYVAAYFDFMKIKPDFIIDEVFERGFNRHVLNDCLSNIEKKFATGLFNKYVQALIALFH